jgi:hypothetical protein
VRNEIRSCDVVVVVLLGRDAVWNRRQKRTFLRNILSPSSGRLSGFFPSGYPTKILCIVKYQLYLYHLAFVLGWMLCYVTYSSALKKVACYCSN